MSIPILEVRKFKADDANFLQFCFTTHANLLDNLADFSNFDGDLDANFASHFLDAAKAAQNYSSDAQLIDVQAQQTINVENKMTECRNYFQMMKYFIEKTFATNQATWNEFGYNDYNEIRRSHEKMIQFMFDLHETAFKYQTPLTTAGFDLAKINQIQLLATELQALNITQEQIKGSRYTATNERVILLNAAWQYLDIVCRAGKTLYADNYGKYQLFLQPWGNEGSPSGPSNSYSGSIISGATLNINIPNLLGNTVLTITNTGPVPLQFCGSTVAGNPCAGGLVLNGGDSRAITLDGIMPPGSNPTFLNVSHIIAPAGSVDGEYLVTVL